MIKLEYIHYSQLHLQLQRRILKKFRTRTRIVELAIFLLILTIFGLKITGYLRTDIFNPVSWMHGIQHEYNKTSYIIGELKYFGKCPVGEQKIDIRQQYLCRQHTSASIYQKIYDTYPRNPNGNEIIYPYYNQWSLNTAQDFLKDKYDVGRYKSVVFKAPLTWNEDPYNDEYWRFNFYSLRITKDLLDAATTTRNPIYTNKLLEIVNSFDKVGVNKSDAWRDPHAVAWRTLTMTNIWWKLRSINQLPINTSNQILATIQKQGQFLSNPAHYEAQYNHGTNEAAALYEIGVSFPDMPGAKQWLSLGKQRLDAGLSSIIDADGALIEHSPYYDFYALVKYWDIYQYSKKYDQIISNNFYQKITSMINYATYILEPDNEIPIVGSSLKAQVHNSEEYAEMTNFSPEFKYVITKGQKGTVPKNTSVQFKTTGQTIMRSGWQAKNYTQQTQLIFNYWAFITNHSQLDNLSIGLYGGGRALLSNAGLYTYSKNALHDYFYGSSAQNTVTVDGQNQIQGSGSFRNLITNSDYSTQSASNQLNPHITQERQVTMLDSKLIVIIDRLHASDNKTHIYQQLFHLAPGLSYSHSGLIAAAQGAKPQQRLSITQLLPKGLSLSDTYNDRDPDHLGGLCSENYEVLEACHQLAYTQSGKDVTFVTLLQVGKLIKSLSYKISNSNNLLSINEAGKQYTINIRETGGHNISAKASDPKPPLPQESDINTFANPSDWVTTGGNLINTMETYSPGKPSVDFSNQPGQQGVMSKSVSLNLLNNNLLFRMKIPSTPNVKDLNLLLYSNSSYAQMRLKDSYEQIHDNDSGSVNGIATIQESGGWSGISLGKGKLRNQQGQWSVYGNDFDWSAISKIAFQIDSNDGASTHVLLSQFSQTLSQKTGKVVLVFDDGSSSILPAISAMKAHHFVGNIAVIGKYTVRQSPGYLSVEQLKTIKQEGWSLVNHSYYHQDAIAEYYNTGNLDGFRADLLSGAKLLEDNGLDTDPNWYIYPHGTTNTAIENIVGQYYKFARSELTAPEVFPFGNPLAVKDFIVEDSTAPQDVANAIDDAKTYNLTLLLTFHRIHAVPTDRSGYDLQNFKAILDHLSKSGIQVMNFNQLDASNDLSINKLHITPASPQQLDSDIMLTNPSLLHRIHNLL